MGQGKSGVSPPVRGVEPKDHGIAVCYEYIEEAIANV